MVTDKFGSAKIGKYDLFQRFYLLLVTKQKKPKQKLGFFLIIN